MNSSIALITGATSGIGQATARLLASHGFDVIITGRRKEKLQQVEKEIRKATGADVLSLVFDIGKRKEAVEILGGLAGKWNNIDVLVNNAGGAIGLDLLQEGDMDDWDTMIDANVKGLLYVTRTLVPGMIKRGHGHIINLGSIAGKEVYEKGNVYCASKFAVDALTRGMRIDLMKHGIKVSSICPGLVETEFSVVRFKGDIEKAKVPYQGLTPLRAEDIADAILYVITRPAHVNINDMLIMPTAQASSIYVHRKQG